MSTKDRGVFVALANVRSLYNVGSIFRSADAFGFSRVILGGYTGSPPRREISKTALGAEKWIPWERRFQLGRALKEYKRKGFSIVGLENNIPHITSLPDFSPSFPLILVVGNEVKGISKRIKKEIDAFVSIPMRGKKESLNVAVAFGIAACHISLGH